MTDDTTRRSRPGAEPLPEGRPGDWHAIHIYYAANPQPLLVQCVRPLVEELNSAGLLAGYFFINYWVEGPHVRLRLKPVTAAATEEVCRRAEAAVSGFLRRRPALYKIDDDRSRDLHNSLVRMEMSPQEAGGYLDEDGRMKYRGNNTFSYEPYAPEYGKYGGTEGVALAEWHFQRSSDLVIDLLRTKNMHLRTFRLGTSAQLMMVMSACFLPTTGDLAQFLDTYHAFWHRYVNRADGIGVADYGRDYDSMAEKLTRRFAHVRQVVGDGDLTRLPGYLSGWAAHCRQLRDRVCRLAVDGELVFGTAEAAGEAAGEARITDPEAALIRLLTPYLHMTNNRLHVSVVDEAYLSYLLGRTLRDHTRSGVGVS